MTALAAFTARSLRSERPRPFGASIVHTKSGKVLLRALNRVAQEFDPSCHAEVRSIRLATKRLATVFEWPIPSFFTPMKQLVRAEKALALMMIATTQVEALCGVLEAAGGEVTFASRYEGPRTQPLLGDYTWNHTTLWAMKADAVYTYLQCGFFLCFSDMDSCDDLSQLRHD